MNSGRNSCVGGTLIMELVPRPTGLVYVVFFCCFYFVGFSASFFVSIFDFCFVVVLAKSNNFLQIFHI